MKRLWQIGNILALLAALVANTLIGAQLLNLPAIKEVSDTYSTLLTPASYAFSIWSVIYILLIVFVIYQARDMFKRTQNKENVLPQQLSWYFIAANLLNAAWVFLFVSGFIALSVVALLFLTFCLITVLRRLRVALDDKPLPTILFVWWPLMLYAGWVIVASVVNVASWLDSIDIILTAIVACATLVLLGGTLLASLLLANLREFVLASSWGITAIGVQQTGEGGNYFVAITAFTIVIALVVSILLHAFHNRKNNSLFTLIS